MKQTHKEVQTDISGPVVELFKYDKPAKVMLSSFGAENDSKNTMALVKFDDKPGDIGDDNLINAFSYVGKEEKKVDKSSRMAIGSSLGEAESVR